MSEIKLQDCELWEVRLVVAVSNFMHNAPNGYQQALDEAVDSFNCNDVYVLDREQRRLVVLPEVTA